MDDPTPQDDLWLVKRPFSIADPLRGRRELRPGTVVSLGGMDTASLTKRGYIELLSTAAPLFTDSPDVKPKPMRRKKEN